MQAEAKKKENSRIIDLIYWGEDYFNNNKFENPKQEIEWLKKALLAERVTLANLPEELKERLIAKDGRVLISITPKEDIIPVKAMRRFTNDVMQAVPKVTGRPVLDLGIGDIVVKAFVTAILIAILLIFFVLMQEYFLWGANKHQMKIGVKTGIYMLCLMFLQQRNYYLTC